MNQMKFFDAQRPGGGKVQCCICGRPLTDPKSIEAGMGPVCGGKHRAAGDDRPTTERDQFLPIPLDQGIVCRRENGVPKMNIAHVIRHHSTCGMEFGYAGSGPADLALNAVEALLRRIGYRGPRKKMYGGECFDATDLLHQRFKFDFIAGMDQERGGTIPIAAAERWVRINLGDL